ncbi:unnamed protein product [Cladocopium goreaui]|uniref:Dynein regulatory complex protein 12 n=1 Tax=Cladocopium goreaui TaxID=2562237 RepID=A0A9P1FKH0_9DINO|nr:unnamed protein product [Cladocopium goreaui]
MGKKGKGKKGGKEALGVPLAPAGEDNYMFLSMQVETLERELQVKSAQAEEAQRSELELRARVEQMEEDFKQEQNTTYAVTADMARQYKALQEELIYKINSLEIQHTEQREELDITNHELKELTLVKDADIENKDQQIKQLNERMNDMSAEFANMLAETLDLMKLHINEKLSDAALGDADASRPDFTQRLQDFSNKAYNAVAISSKSDHGKALPPSDG